MQDRSDYAEQFTLRQWATDPMPPADPTGGFIADVLAQGQIVWGQTTSAATGELYSWEEIVENPGESGWSTLDGGIIGTLNARDAGGQTDLEIGTIGLFIRQPAGEGAEWVFLPVPGQSGQTINNVGTTTNYDNTSTINNNGDTINNTGSTTNYNNTSIVAYAGATINYAATTENYTSNSTINVSSTKSVTFQGGGTFVFSPTFVTFTSTTVNVSSATWNFTTVTTTVNAWNVTFATNVSTWTLNVGLIFAGAGPWTLNVATVNIGNNALWTFDSTTYTVFNGLFEVCAGWNWCWATIVNWTVTPPGNPWNAPGLKKVVIPVKPPAAGVPLQGIAQPQDPSGNPIPYMFRVPNVGSGPMQIKPLAGATSVENIATPNGLDYFIQPGQSVDFNYDTTNLQWICSNGPPFGQDATTTTSTSGTYTADLNVTDRFEITMTGNIILSVTNATTGSIFTADFIQDSTGGRTISTSFTTVPATLPTATTTANTTTKYVFQKRSDGKWDVGLVFTGAS
jgi:hypothetical protein